MRIEQSGNLGGYDFWWNSNSDIDIGLDNHSMRLGQRGNQLAIYHFFLRLFVGSDFG